MRILKADPGAVRLALLGQARPVADVGTGLVAARDLRVDTGVELSFGDI